MSRVALGAGLVVCAVALAGCTGAGAPSAASVSAGDDSGDPQSNFEYLARGYLEDAESQGLSDDQVALVERAVQAGAVSFEDYEAALQNTFDCWEKAGIYYEVYAPNEDHGFPVIDYFVAAPPGGDPVADVCQAKNSNAIESLYQIQPSSQEAKDAKFEAAIPAVAACLRERGYLVDVPDPTLDQVKEALGVAQEENPLRSGSTEDPFPQICLIAAGVQGY